jgi:hypothetical protein
MKLLPVAILMLSFSCGHQSKDKDQSNSPNGQPNTSQSSITNNFDATGSLVNMQPNSADDVKLFYGYCQAKLSSFTFSIFGDARVTGEYKGSARYKGESLSLYEHDVEIYRCQSSKSFAAPFPPAFFEKFDFTFFAADSSYLSCKALVKGYCEDFVAGEKCSFDPNCSQPGRGTTEKQ